LLKALAMELEAEHRFFERILPELQKTHLGKYALIEGESLIQFFETRSEAIQEGFKKIPHQAIYVKQDLEKYEPVKFFSIA
jgi:hypothetical protein